MADKMTNTLLQLFHWIVKNKGRTLLLTGLITIIVGLGIPKIKIDQSMDSFLEANDDTVKVFKLFRYMYGSDDYIIMMYQNHKGDIFDPEGLKKLKKLEDALNKKRLDANSPLSRIKRVRSIISADFLESKNDNLINRPFIQKIPETPAEIEALKALARKHRDFKGTFFSDDFRYGVLLIETDYGSRVQDEKSTESKNEEEEDFSFDDTQKEGKLIDINKVPSLDSPEMNDYVVFMRELNKIVKDNGLVSQLEKKKSSFTYLMAGNPWLMGFFAERILTEMGLCALGSLLIIITCLYLSFRSWTAMIWPTIIVVMTLIFTMGIMGHSGIVQTMMINILVFMVLAVGIADSVHILAGVRYYLRQDLPYEKALEESFRKSATSIALTSFTTMAGLSSLAFSPVVPVRVFALFAALGVFLAFVMTVVLLPALLSYFPLRVKEEEKKTSLFDPIITKMNEWSKTRPYRVYSFFIVIALILSIGVPKVYIDTNMLNMIKPGYGIHESYNTIDKHFGGTASIEILLNTGKVDGVKDPDFLKALDHLGLELKKERADLVSRVNSLANLTKNTYEILTENEKNYKIPDTKNVLDQTLFSFESADSSTRKMVVDDDWQMARLTINVITKGSKEYNQFTEETKKRAEKVFKEYKKKNPKLDIRLTGMLPLMFKMTENISISQIRSFAIIISVISLLFLFLFKSFKIGLLALIPNLFPILVILGVTGLFGIPLDSDTLLVVPIAIGLAVDDTIHFLMHYQNLRNVGVSVPEALEKASREVGHAIIYTSTILSLGFLIFVVSASKPFTYFGILSSLSIFTALLADLFLLPAIILKIEKQPLEST